jgi:UDP-N-acetyl-D-mannosaminuronate dehydrogenase
MDLVLISTDHSIYDYDWLAENTSLIVDTRNSVKAKKICGKSFCGIITGQGENNFYYC